MKLTRTIIPFLIVCLVAVVVMIWRWKTPPPELPTYPNPRQGLDRPSARPPSAGPPLSTLAPTPDWDELNRWQGTITRSEFLTMIEDVFTVSPEWRKWFHLGEQDLLIETGIPEKRFRLRFAPDDASSASNPRDWRAADELPAPPENLPLDELKIAIDPGHLGGPWGEIEGRWFQIRNETPVKEGDMTLLVANLLKPRLEALGAKVDLVRETTEPVTSYRPESLLDLAQETNPNAPRQLAEKLFYRTSEIRARAELVNQRLRPDLVLCLHFNAEEWGNPAAPRLVPRHHFHILVNGAYTDGELPLADHRYHLMRRIVEKTHSEEAAVAASVANSFVKKTGLPPYLYEIDSSRAVNVDGNPYLWARNLLANRIYNRPVVFLEPYVMNSTLDYPRIQAGDYEGERKVDGRLRPSIFREYADAVANGLADHYRTNRPEP